MKNVDGFDGDNDVQITLPSLLGAFILGNSERVMKNFITEINGFQNNNICYGDTDSL